MSHNLIKGLKINTFRNLVEQGIIYSKENVNRAEYGRVMDFGENAVLEAQRLKRVGKSNEEIKKHLDNYMEELGLQIYEQYKYQQAIYYSLADIAYREIGMLAPNTA